MRSPATRILALSCIALLAVALPVVAVGRDVRAGAARGSSTTTASGHATYGYGGHGGYGHGGYGHGGYPYHGVHVGVGFYGGWGWPYYGYGYGWPYYGGYGYGWPYYYGAPWYAGYYGTYPGTAYYPVYRGERESLPAAVETNVQPKKAAVIVDGQNAGKAKDFNAGSWGPLFLEPGRHVLEFSAPGYQSLRTEIDARAGARYSIAEQLVKGEGLDARSIEPPSPTAEPPATPAPEVVEPETSAAPEPSPALRTGLLRLRVSPGDAAVYLDGEFLARAGELARLHGAIPVVRGEHLVEVVMPGYASASRRVEVADGAPMEVRIDLAR